MQSIVEYLKVLLWGLYLLLPAFSLGQIKLYCNLFTDVIQQLH